MMPPMSQEEMIGVSTTSEVVDRHVRSFEANDVEALLADYAPDAVLFTPSGPLKGPDAIRPLFEALVSEFRKPDTMFAVNHRSVDRDYAYLLWTADTADNRYDVATDTFVIRNGKIVAQSFAARIIPKA